ncbi:hypothetical protein PHMEG_00020765 [Phytophthora megakarya]|uniref:Uncharacterized protein n=1 Tax=Phytophthora megakarya TaxID=4795 RepID=A0A225VQ65_9STRA|nr:hypothetical protein PHMEG_00020765 [Phytophthora megakarya]
MTARYTVTTQDLTYMEFTKRCIYQVLLLEVQPSAKREDKEHVCDYLNWPNGYARNAGLQFENGGREP